jgi:hypothetical protein
VRLVLAAGLASVVAGLACVVADRPASILRWRCADDRLQIDQFQDDVVSVVFVLTAMLTFVIGCMRYYTVKAVLNTKDADMQCVLRRRTFVPVVAS